MITWEALDALSHQFELCGIGPGSSVVALLRDEPLAEIVRAALARSRADVLDVRSVHDGNGLEPSLASSPMVAALLEEADVLIDALSASGVHDVPDHLRVLRLHPHAVHADEWPPHANLALRVDAAAQRVGSAGTFTVQDRHGTHLVVRTDGARVVTDGGRAANVGDVAYFPAGWLRVTPAAGRVDGELVLMPGDGNIDRGGHIDAPIRIEIENDLITTIEGEHASADIMRAQLEHFERADAYGIASISLGLNPGRGRTRPLFDPDLLDPVLAPLSAGVVTVAFGENLHADRPCPGQVTLALPGRSVATDELALSVDGQLVGEIAPDVYEAPG